MFGGHFDLWSVFCYEHFYGVLRHRIIDCPFLIEQQLEKLIRELLTEKEYVEFLVGRDGEFDQPFLAVRRCKRAIRDDNSALVWVMPLRDGGVSGQ